MSRVETAFCDICKKPTEHIARKLFISFVGRTNQNRSPSSDYTHHLDVGDCCEKRLLAGFNWKERMTATQYRERRKRKKAA